MLDVSVDRLDRLQFLDQRLRAVEQRLDIQCRLSQLLAQAETLDAAIEDTLHLLCEGFEWRFGEYWSISEESQRLKRQYFWILPGETIDIDSRETEAEFSYGVGLPGQIWANNAPLYFENLKQNPNFLRHDFAEHLNLKHGYGVPICDRNRLVGVITFLTQTDQSLDDELIDLLRVLGEQLGLFLQRKSAELQLSQYALRLENTLTELRQTQAQMIHREKMSSLGQLVAGIAHEINNPINFIHGNLKPAQEYYQDFLELLKLYESTYPNPTDDIIQKREEINLEFLQDDFQQLLQSMKNGTDRIREIVLSLRNFSRLDEAERKVVNIHDGIESALLILQNRFKARSSSKVPHLAQGIHVVKDYGDLPPIDCYPGQLNQVFMHLLTNAIDALEVPKLTPQARSSSDQPRLQIRTEIFELDQSPWIRLTIADNGCGIAEDLQSKIFNPFFTTKAVGQGQGLGLSISYKIIAERHQGHLYCQSAIGEGSLFIVEIPVVIPH